MSLLTNQTAVNETTSFFSTGGGGGGGGSGLARVLQSNTTIIDLSFNSLTIGTEIDFINTTVSGINSNGTILLQINLNTVSSGVDALIPITILKGGEIYYETETYASSQQPLVPSVFTIAVPYGANDSFQIRCFLVVTQEMNIVVKNGSCVLFFPTIE